MKVICLLLVCVAGVAQAGFLGGSGLVEVAAPAIHGGYVSPSFYSGYAGQTIHGGYAAPGIYGSYAAPAYHTGYASAVHGGLGHFGGLGHSKYIGGSLKK